MACIPTESYTVVVPDVSPLTTSFIPVAPGGTATEVLMLVTAVSIPDDTICIDPAADAVPYRTSRPFCTDWTNVVVAASTLAYPTRANSVYPVGRVGCVSLSEISDATLSVVGLYITYRQYQLPAEMLDESMPLTPLIAPLNATLTLRSNFVLKSDDSTTSLS